MVCVTDSQTPLYTFPILSASHLVSNNDVRLNATGFTYALSELVN